VPNLGNLTTVTCRLTWLDSNSRRAGRRAAREARRRSIIMINLSSSSSPSYQLTSLLFSALSTDGTQPHDTLLFLPTRTASQAEDVAMPAFLSLLFFLGDVFKTYLNHVRSWRWCYGDTSWWQGWLPYVLVDSA
jgi:hypothetical protein